MQRISAPAVRRFVTLAVFAAVLGLMLAGSVSRRFGFIAKAKEKRPPASLTLQPPAAQLDVSDTKAVFSHVFAQLPDQVDVLPTENYLYFRFHTDSLYLWGNIRLAREDRDKGVLHLGYYEYRDDVTSPEDAHARHVTLDASSGVIVNRLEDFRYMVEFSGKRVEFQLNRLPQTPPRAYTMAPGEEMMFRLQDESNIRFVLLYNHRSNSFYYVADEDDEQLAVEGADGHLAVEPESRFVFFVDKKNNGRKILVGVHNENVRRNTYYDGPFDQLADNFITDNSVFGEYVQRAYLHTRGRIDSRGVFLDQADARTAILPYHTYQQIEDIASVVSACASFEGTDTYYACLSRDEQQLNAVDPAVQALEETCPASGEAAASGKSAQRSTAAPPRCTPHDTGFTYLHRPGVTWIPPGTRHDAGHTYVHRPGVTWIPPNTPHDSGITYQHRTGLTWIPPGTRHDAGLTYTHRPGISWIPPGTPHTTGATYQHQSGLTWIPPGTRHDAGGTYVHRPGVTWIPPNTPHTTGTTYRHYAGVTWIPPNTRHDAGITYSHRPGVSWIPPNTPHTVGTTYRHYAGVTWIPPNTRHDAGLTYVHRAGVTWVPPNARHITGQTYVHVQGTTWPR